MEATTSAVALASHRFRPDRWMDQFRKGHCIASAIMPAYWFQVVEATFQLHRITSEDTKYRHILTNLDPTTIPFVADITNLPPVNTKPSNVE